MKILKAGQCKDPKWIGKKITCEGCCCRFQLEKGDTIMDGGFCDKDSCFCDDHHTPQSHLAVRCPECKTKVLLPL